MSWDPKICRISRQVINWAEFLDTDGDPIIFYLTLKCWWSTAVVLVGILRFAHGRLNFNGSFCLKELKQLGYVRWKYQERNTHLRRIYIKAISWCMLKKWENESSENGRVQEMEEWEFREFYSVKRVQIRSFFWSVITRIQPKYGKIRTIKNSVFGQFSHSVRN